MNNMFLKLLEKYGAPVTNIISAIRIDAKSRNNLFAKNKESSYSIVYWYIFSHIFYGVNFLCFN